MSRQARTRSSLALGLIAFLVAGLWFANRQLARAGEAPIKGGDSAAKATVFPLPTDFKEKLLRAGLTPRALAAAGVSPASVLPTLQAAADEMNSTPTALDTADASYASARTTSDALAARIQSGKANQEDLASYLVAKTALVSAEATRQSEVDGYFTAATANLTSNQRAALVTIRANRAWGFPEEYLVVERTEAQWLALRDALSIERQVSGLPDMTSESATQILATFRADPAVSFATTGVQTSLIQITTAWNTAAGG